MNRLGTVAAVAVSAVLAGCAYRGPIAAPKAQVSYVSFQTLDEAKPLPEAGVLRIPVGIDRRVPAVVIVHGSAGVDSRGFSYATDLNQAGIATLEIDMWTARGIRGSEGRPKGVPETLPDAYAAFKLLAAHPAIDPDRIGIMGFSWGGVVSMLTASRTYSDRYLGKGGRFASVVASQGNAQGCGVQHPRRAHGSTARSGGRSGPR